MNLLSKGITLALMLSVVSAPAQNVTTEHSPIIDVHFHSEYTPRNFLPSGPPYQMCFDPFNIVDPFPVTKPGEDIRLKDMFECLGEKMVSPMTEEELDKQVFDIFKKYNVVAVVDSNFDLEYAARWADRSPAKSIPASMVVRQMPTNRTPEETRKLIEEGKIKVIGEIAVQYDGLAPNDPYLDPYWALAVEYDIPAAIHIGPGAPGGDYIGGQHGVNRYRSDKTLPLLMEDVLRRHQGLRVYIMHAGYPRLDDMLLLMLMHPQVYVDIAMIASDLPRKEFYRYLRTMVEAGYGKRIMFGSDHTVWPQIIEKVILAIDEADFLTAEQKEDIFYNNAIRFFRLTEADLKK